MTKLLKLSDKTVNAAVRWSQAVRLHLQAALHADSKGITPFRLSVDSFDPSRELCSCHPGYLVVSVAHVKITFGLKVHGKAAQARSLAYHKQLHLVAA
jgi:hypothetical protein